MTKDNVTLIGTPAKAMSAWRGFLLLDGYLGEFSATHKEIAFPANDEAI